MARQAKMRGIYRRPGTKNWEICFQDENGKTKRISSGTPIWSKARDKRIEEVNKVKRIQGGLEERITELNKHRFFELCDEYLKTCTGQARENTKAYIVPILKKKFGDVPIQNIVSLKVFQDFQLELATIGLDSQRNLAREQASKPRVPCSERGVDFYVGILKSMLILASDWGWISYDNLKKVLRKIKMNNPDSRERFLSEEEVAALISACGTPMEEDAEKLTKTTKILNFFAAHPGEHTPNDVVAFLGDISRSLVTRALKKIPFEINSNGRITILDKVPQQYEHQREKAVHLQDIVITALRTGMRRGEIFKLTWSQIDLAHGFINLPWTNTKKKKNRHIPIDTEMRALFTALPKRADVPYIFFNPETLKRYTTVTRSFNTACKLAGIEDFHFHDLRHTFASHYAMNNGNMKQLQEILGHRSPKQTERYSHLADKFRLKAVSVMDKIPGRRSL